MMHEHSSDNRQQGLVIKEMIEMMKLILEPQTDLYLFILSLLHKALCKYLDPLRFILSL
jgi:hypothetical protein